MPKLDIPPHVLRALGQQVEDERRERVRMRQAELDAARRREPLRPLATLILEWAAALAASGLVPDAGIGVKANTGSGRRRDGIIVGAGGGVSVYHWVSPYGGGCSKARSEDDLLLWPADVDVVKDIAAAIVSGEIWDRVLRGLPSNL